MRIAVISDIHGNLLALQAVLADIARAGVDQTVNLGDILSGPLQVAETADLLMASNFPTIRGNHERQLLAVLGPPAGQIDPLDSDGYAATQVSPAHVAWINALPVSMALDRDVWLCHGTPGNDLQYWLETVVPGFEQGLGPGGGAGRPPSMRWLSAWAASLSRWCSAATRMCRAWRSAAARWS